MEINIDFPGGARVDAHFGPHTVHTDQPPAGGGEGSAPSPFEIFLCSIGTCAGVYVLGFCKQRNISTEGIRIIQSLHRNPSNGMVDNIDLEIRLPPEFPEKYRTPLIKSAELCTVKKHLENPPQIKITTKETD